MANKTLAVLTVTIAEDKVATHLESNPGELSYKDMAVQFRVAAEHLDRLDPDEPYTQHTSIEHIAVDATTGLPLKGE